MSKAGGLGNSRIVRDKVAELHALIQEWNSHISTGCEVLKEINSIDLSKGSDFKSNLYALCTKLQNITEQMEIIIQNMKAVVDNLKAVSKLQNGDDILFKTWPISKFENSCTKIYTEYKKELGIKQTVTKSVADRPNEAYALAYFNAWMIQTWITADSTMALEAMLLETELKSVNK